MKTGRDGLAAAIQRLEPTIRLVLLHGADAAASSDLARQLSRQFIDTDDPIGNTIINGTTLTGDPAALVAAVSEVSMFGGTRLIRVDDAVDDTLAAVDLVLDAAPGGNPVVVIAGILKKGSKLLTRIEASPAALAHVSYLPDTAGVALSIDTIGTELGVHLTHPARAAVAAATGGDRGIVRQELIKLALYLNIAPKTPGQADVADVEAIGADLGEADFSVLVDSIASGRPDVADRQLAGFRTSSIPGITLLRAVARRFWLLLSLRQIVDGGASAARAVEGARPPIFWKEKSAVVTQLAQWRTPAVRNVLAQLVAAERAIKQSGSAGDVAVDQLLLKIASQNRR